MTRFAKYMYILIFVLIIFEPLIIRRGIFHIPQEYLQALGNTMLIGLAYVIYTIHQTDLQRKDAEKKGIQEKLQISTEKLNEAFEYIGRVNRELPLLQNVTTDLLELSPSNTKQKKALFEELLRSAVISIAKRKWGMIRFVNIEKEKTTKEFTFSQGNYVLMKTNISNKELTDLFENIGRFGYLKDIVVIKTSDRHASVQCFLILPKEENQLDNVYSTLQAITDQAQLYYNYLFEAGEKDASEFPLFEAK